MVDPIIMNRKIVKIMVISMKNLKKVNSKEGMMIEDLMCSVLTTTKAKGGSTKTSIIFLMSIMFLRAEARSALT